MTLNEGDIAPDFQMLDADGKIWRLADLRGRKVILYFYPIDDTPGCTIEACDFRDSYGDLVESGYTVLGVSPQGRASKRAFIEKYGLNFPLLIDEGGDVAKAYGVWKERGVFQGIPVVINRSTFVIEEDGRIAQALIGVDPRGHVAELKAMV
ncbi:MAG: peroxiredoxin [Actinomycetota bacterium]